ncbi:MAG: hypothetical protein LBN40_02595 [Oscillospiraceae bacterium]|jgi:hypothetical protein|nr:hypothetical protein [Oscillospiraceae bacterium]
MKEALLNLCIVAMLGGLFRMLVPDGTFKKQASFLSASFFLVSVMYFIGAGKFDIAELTASLKNGGEYVDFTEEITEERKRAIAAEVSGRLRGEFASNGLEVKKIYVVVNITGLYGISVSEVRLVCERAEDSAELLRIAKAELGPTVKVVVEDVNNGG